MYKRKIGMAKALMITYYLDFTTAKEIYKTICLNKEYDVKAKLGM